MLSRVADSIYWMNRYIERAENTARFIDVNLKLTLDLPDSVGEQWTPLVETAGDIAPFEERYEEPTKENVIEFLVFDRENPNSILRCLESARENARSIREFISLETWEQLNGFYHFVRSREFRDLFGGEPHEFFDRIKTESHQFAGVFDATMPHGEGWQFARLGRFLERADKTSRILDVKYFILLPSVHDVGSAFDELQWAALLRSASAFEAYRKRFGRIEPDKVAEFLLMDEEFPRSILHCVIVMDEALRRINGAPTGFPAERHLGLLRANLTYARMEDIIGRGLHQFLDDLQAELNRVGDDVFDQFFTLRPVAGAVFTGGASQA